MWNRLTATAFLTLQLGDIFTTHIAITRGAHEANHIMHAFGPWYWLPKLAVALTIAAYLLFYPRRTRLSIVIISVLLGLCGGVVINNLIVAWLA